MKHWSKATPIRTIFREAFEAADLAYFNPHSFRKTLVTLGQQLCQTPEEIKSWSQNLGNADEIARAVVQAMADQQQLKQLG